jgi:tetratricopeptide (TPR) repeat protein
MRFIDRNLGGTIPLDIVLEFPPHEQEPADDPLMPSWGHAEAYAWIGLAHMEAERYDDARSAFQTALDLDSDFGWVQEVLLPRLNEQAG